MKNINNKKISIIIPCFNEKKTLLNLIEKVLLSLNAHDYGFYEILLVDDFSSDGTKELIKKNFSLKKNFKTFFHDKNMGKGAAIKTAKKFVTGDIILIQDADLEYDPQEYPLLIEPIIKNIADVVYGSRFQSGRPHRVVYFWHRIGNGFLTLLSNFFTDLNLSDMETCYKAFRTEIIKSINIQEKRFGFEPEITAKISKMDLRIYEVGISYYGRTYKEGKKINWKDGFYAIWCIFKYNRKN